MIQISANDPGDLNSLVKQVLNHLDPQSPIRDAFQRFAANQSRDGDYPYLYKYGNRETYEEITRRLLATGKLDPGPWSWHDQAVAAARYGRNSAIPLLAELLQQTNITGGRSIRREIDEIVAAIIGPDDLRRRKTVASMGEVYSYKSQRALLIALDREKDTFERLNILARLKSHPALWHLPTLTRLMVADQSAEIRTAAARLIKAAMRERLQSFGAVRIDTWDTALDAARTLANDANAPAQLRIAAVGILMVADTFIDEPLLRKLAGEEPFKNDSPLQTLIDQKNNAAKASARMVSPQD